MDHKVATVLSSGDGNLRFIFWYEETRGRRGTQVGAKSLITNLEMFFQPQTTKFNKNVCLFPTKLHLFGFSVWPDGVKKSPTGRKCVMGGETNE